MKKPYFVLLKFDSYEGGWYEAGSSHYSLDQVRADAEYEDDGIEPLRILKVFDERDISAVQSKALKLLDGFGKRPPYNAMSIFLNWGDPNGTLDERIAGEVSRVGSRF